MKRQVKKTVQKGLCMLLAGVAVLTASLSLTACVDQHPDSTEGQSQTDSVRLVATSPAVAQICDKLELDLVGVCRTSGTCQSGIRMLHGSERQCRRIWRF